MSGPRPGTVRPKKPRTPTPEQVAACPPGARVIPLSRGWVAWVGEEDYPDLSVYRWSARCSQNHPRTAYAVRTSFPRGRRGARVHYLMHRVLLDAPGDSQVDHREWPAEKVVDNRRSNLRLCTPFQNLRNMRPRVSSTAGLKGVSLDRRKLEAGWPRPWQARIRLNGEGASKSLGYHETPAEAAFAYDLAAVEHFGEFARTNYGAEHSLASLVARLADHPGRKA